MTPRSARVRLAHMESSVVFEIAVVTLVFDSPAGVLMIPVPETWGRVSFLDWSCFATRSGTRHTRLPQMYSRVARWMDRNQFGAELPPTVHRSSMYGNSIWQQAARPLRPSLLAWSESSSSVWHELTGYLALFSLARLCVEYDDAVWDGIS
ncbi:hypothetical protein RRF57_008343 [Xylaria bambusicola]|uniref:Uncharacterized protein n=1 Tax=Xylaria bambusicola TaxID=326684 RepID=A0AAN7V1M4_9PEZI